MLGHRPCVDGDPVSTVATQARVWETPPGIQLGALDLVDDGGARGFVIERAGARFHGFVVRIGARVIGYVDRCPHAGLPLARALDQYLTPDRAYLACSWHGAVFSLEEGLCVGGPCVGTRLVGWPVEVENGVMITSKESV